MKKVFKVVFIPMFILGIWIYTSDLDSHAVVDQGQDVRVDEWAIHLGEVSLKGTSSENENIIVLFTKGRFDVYSLPTTLTKWRGNFVLTEVGLYDIWVIQRTKDKDFKHSIHFRVNNIYESFLKEESIHRREMKPKQSGRVSLNVTDAYIQMEALAKEITKNARSDFEKARIITAWVSEHIRYNRDKFVRFQQKDYRGPHHAGYTFMTQEGVCNDFALLAKQLAECVGIKSRVVEGMYAYADERQIFHAWNEFYLKEEQRWVLADTAMSALFLQPFFDDVFEHEKYQENLSVS